MCVSGVDICKYDYICHDFCPLLMSSYQLNYVTTTSEQASGER